MQVIEPASWTAQPWKNGAGTTHEVLRLPDVAAFMVRLSVADIGSPAPFSSFPGYHRWLYLIGGGPLTLAVGGEGRTLAGPGDGLAFPGDSTVSAIAVARPSRDLNFMVRADLAARAQVLREPTAQTLEGTFVAVFVIAGEAAMTRGDERWELGRHACGWLTDGEVTVEPLPGGMAATLVVEAHSA